MNYTSVLASCCLFKDKSRMEIEHILSKINYKIKHFKKDEIIFSYHQIADTMGIILTGFADVQMVFPTGKLILVNRKAASDLIAEPAVFSDITYYPATLIVNKACSIMLIQKSEMKKLFILEPDIMFNFVGAISNSTLILKQQIEVLSYNSIQEKIACFLIKQYNAHKSKKIILPFSKKTWSEYMNVSRTSLSRELSILRKYGIIVYNKKVIEIKNYDKLNKILLENVKYN